MEINSRPGTPAQGKPAPTIEEKREQWRKERQARRRRRMAARLIGLVLAFIAGMALGYALRDGGQQDPAQAATTTTNTPPASVTSFDPAAIITYAPPPMDNPRELWSIDHGQEDTPLLDVDLDPVTQWGIYTAACDRDPAIFCAVMAIGYTESRFNADTGGDGGDSLGMMQINTRYHGERMEALGVTDLTDPVQCALVAVDYLKELMDSFQADTGDHVLYMAYNMGPKGAREAVQAGTTSTAYSRGIMALYLSYMEEMEAAK